MKNITGDELTDPELIAAYRKGFGKRLPEGLALPREVIRGLREVAYAVARSTSVKKNECIYCGQEIVWSENSGWVLVMDGIGVAGTQDCSLRYVPSYGHAVLSPQRDF